MNSYIHKIIDKLRKERNSLSKTEMLDAMETINRFSDLCIKLKVKDNVIPFTQLPEDSVLVSVLEMRIAKEGKFEFLVQHLTNSNAFKSEDYVKVSETIELYIKNLKEHMGQCEVKSDFNDYESDEFAGAVKNFVNKGCEKSNLSDKDLFTGF